MVSLAEFFAQFDNEVLHGLMQAPEELTQGQKEANANKINERAPPRAPVIRSYGSGLTDVCVGTNEFEIAQAEISAQSSFVVRDGDGSDFLRRHHRERVNRFVLFRHAQHALLQQLALLELRQRQVRNRTELVD